MYHRTCASRSYVRADRYLQCPPMGRAGNQPSSAAEQLIEVDGLGVGAASERVVQVATAHGYTVVASGPNRFRMARTYRPQWALVAAVATAVFVGLGLLFLTVKRTETGDVVVSEDRSGVKVRLTGALRPQAVEALRQALRVPTSSRSSTPIEPASYRGPASAPFVPLAHATAPPLAEPVPAAHSAVPPAPSAPIVRAAEPMLLLADGRSISASVGGVIGRDPAGDPMLPGGLLYPISDPSLSKTHLSFGPLPHGVWVLDHHSTNGTVVSANGMSMPCTPGVRVDAPFGAQVIAGDLSLQVAAR